MSKVTLIDNYDSFTWNLVHYLGALGAEVEVVRNDARTADELRKGFRLILCAVTVQRKPQNLVLGNAALHQIVFH